MDKQTEKIVINIKEKQGLKVNIDSGNNLNVNLSGKQSMKVSGLNPGTLGANYNTLINKPTINEISLVGNKTGKELGLQDKMESLTNMELDDLIQF